MIERSGDLWSQIRHVAGQSIRGYAQGILTVDVLAREMLREWKLRHVSDEQPSHGLLTRIAQRICSRALCGAWRSSQTDLRNRAFDNLRCYLERSLRNSGYALALQENENAIEDVLQQTLEELHLALMRNPSAGPDDPAAFLKWAQTAVIRHAHVYVEKCKSNRFDSLEEQQEALADRFIDEHADDPQERAISRELQQALKDAILSLRNPRYREVLFCTYLGGMDEGDLALRLNVQVQEVYMWRHRALKALRKNPDVMRSLESWRE
jgi:RNA polymerase sigma factor (sigma-70 family)